MAFITVYNQPLFKVYRASTFSWTYVVYVLLRILTYLLPLVLVFASQGLWKKWGTYREMPRIAYKGEYIVIGKGVNDSHFYSTSISPLNQADPQHFVLSEEEHRWQEYTSHSKLTVDLKLFAGNSSVEHLTFMIFFYISLEKNSIVQVQAHIPLIQTINVDSHFRSHQMKGRLKTEQSRPFSLSYNVDILDLDTENIEYYKPEEIIDRALEADLAFTYNRVSTIVHYGHPDVLHLSLTFLISDDEFIYQTGLLELLKWAWIQYFAIFVVTSACINSLFEYMLSNHLLSHVPIKTN